MPHQPPSHPCPPIPCPPLPTLQCHKAKNVMGSTGGKPSKTARAVVELQACTHCLALVVTGCLLLLGWLLPSRSYHAAIT